LPETNEKRARWPGNGADVVLNPAAEDAVAKILAETNGTESIAAGNVRNPTAIQQGFKALQQAARFAAGIRRKTCRWILVNDVIFKGATVQGIYGANVETWVQMTALLKARRLNLEPLFGERARSTNSKTPFTRSGGLAGRSCCIRTACRAERIVLCLPSGRLRTATSGAE